MRWSGQLNVTLDKSQTKTLMELNLLQFALRIVFSISVHPLLYLFILRGEMYNVLPFVLPVQYVEESKWNLSGNACVDY